MEFFSCKFIKCNFLGAKLRQCQFDSCEFVECDASNVTLGYSHFIDARFIECKLLGLNWVDVSSPLKLAFNKCRLDYNVFSNNNLSGLEFIQCLLRDAFFQNCDLTRSSFYGSDLFHAEFEECKLNHADMTDVLNFNISPEKNDISYAVMSIDSALMLLRRYHLTIR
ncbi:pentapeptide repeat-containing protein [Acidithiobacillus ferrianus]|uniref:pentapeptide repeat-containing protein n=1 Tax=Acidithiobacillus ferrianus TaxID=2678518 RepID=UPI00193FFC21